MPFRVSQRAVRTSDAADTGRVSFADAELLRTLEAAFAKHAGAAGVVSSVELQKALGLRSEYLAKRVLRRRTNTNVTRLGTH